MQKPQDKEDLAGSERGSVLVLVPISLVLAVGLIGATLALSTNNMTEARRETRKVQAYYAAKAGLELQIYDVKAMTRTAVLTDPYSAIEAFHNKKTYNNSIKMGSSTPPPNQEPLLDISGEPIDGRADLIDAGITPIGTFDVSIHIEGYDPLNPGALSTTRRFLTIRSTGYSPSKDSPDVVSHTIETTILVEMTSSDVFDYAYFINNWGWFYGNTINANGSVRSNGQFDAGGYSPTINGTPRYLGANGTDLYGYLDDNNDGVRDGSDGGVYAGWDILGSTSMQGMVETQASGDYVNQHEYVERVSMPNLTDLTLYENYANSQGSSVSIGGVQVMDSVFGDDVSELQDIVLIGTAADPIELNGTVVVRGSVIISGVVSGQGVIYSGGNVYVADDVTYLNPPTTNRPAGSSELEFETWTAANAGADALGLFAREHIVLGDYTDSEFVSKVSSWLGNPDNASNEDAGEDGIPNTVAGIDGVAGNEDDDFLEGNGHWDVEEYTSVHEALGLIPDGSAIGDTIPGSGEDIDGDGIHDGTVTMADFEIPHALDSGMWGGNLPGGASDFADISSTQLARFDAAMYTNHTLAGLMNNSGSNIDFNGCIVSRNESLIYRADSVNMNHDARLIGGGDNFGYYLPKAFESIRVMRTRDDLPNAHFDLNYGVAVVIE